IFGSTLMAAEFEYSRPLLSMMWVLSIAFIWTARSVQRWGIDWLRSNGIARDHVLIVGTGDVARSVEEKIRWAPWLGYETVGFVQTTEDLPEDWDGPKILGTIDDLHAIIRERRVRELIVADPTLSHR